jgi:plastocyanin
MNSLRSAFVGAAAALSLTAYSSVALAQPDALLNVTVAFGTGVNTDTSVPSPPANHHIHPHEIRVKRGGTVHFAVSGFHHIVVYDRGVRLEDLDIPNPPTGAFINDFVPAVYYNGFDPGPPGPSNPDATPVPDGYSGARNRVESVYFDKAGRYLVICNVRGHLLDMMFAYVRVLP